MLKWYVILLVIAVLGGWTLYPVAYPAMTGYLVDGKMPELEWDRLKPGSMFSASSSNKSGSKAVPVPKGDQRFKSVVIIEGDHSRGTGFVVKPKDTYFVMTTQSLLAGNRKLAIHEGNGDALRGTTMLAAKNANLAMISIDQPPVGLGYFETPKAVDTVVAVSEEIIVAGDTTGTGNLKLVHGKLTGLLPNALQVNHRLFPALEGAPFYHSRTGNIIGVVASKGDLQISRDLQDSLPSRRASATLKKDFFAQRVDAAGGWVSLDWSDFQSQHQEIEAAWSEVSAIFDYLFGRQMDPPDILKKEVEEAQAAMLHKTLSRKDKLKTLEDVLRVAEHKVKQPLKKLKRGKNYHFVHLQRIRDVEMVVDRVDDALSNSEVAAGKYAERFGGLP